jgi:hypothetical protein
MEFIPAALCITCCAGTNVSGCSAYSPAALFGGLYRAGLLPTVGAIIAKAAPSLIEDYHVAAFWLDVQHAVG